MPRGSKESYSPKQKRMSQVEEGFEKKAASSKKAGRSDWSAVTKETGSTRGKKKSTVKKRGSVH